MLTPFKYRSTLALLAFIISFTIRVIGIASMPLQTDEPHWVGRSSKLIEQLIQNPTNATTHLGHPGVPATVVLALGHIVANQINDLFNLQGGDVGYLDPYSACRVANAFISSLVAPLILSLLTPILGLGTAAFATILLAIDPQYLFLSRIAHIDTTLATLTTTTLLLYLYAVTKPSIPAKIGAGIFWGLSIATKPTALVLVGVFLLFKLLLKLLDKERNLLKESLITWSDIWALLVGNTVLATIYTRLWHHPSEYLTRLRIESSLADFVFQLGRFLKRQDLLAAILIIFALSAAIYFFIRYRKSALKSYLLVSRISVLLLFLLTALILVPQVLENLIRFWRWVFSLSKVEHDGFSGAVYPPAHGYLSFLVSMIPIPITIGWVLGTIRLFIGIQKKEWDLARALVLLCLLGALIWILPLSVSPKQSLRYAVPTLPLIYIISAWGVMWILRSVSPWRRHVLLAAPAAVIAFQITSTFRLYPHYELFLNKRIVPFEASVKSGQIRPLVGMHEGLSFLINDAKSSEKAPTLITVIGDSRVLKEMAFRHHSKGERNIKFGYFAPYHADYLVTMFSLNPPRGLLWDKVTSQEPTFVYELSNIPLLKVWSVPEHTFNDPISLPVSQLGRQTGKIRINAKGSKVLFANPNHHREGYLMFSPYSLKLRPGTYELTFPLSLLSKPTSTNNKRRLPVVTVSFGRLCSKSVMESELKEDEITETTLSCTITQSAGAIPRAYWHGTKPLILEDLKIKRIEPTIKNPTITNKTVELSK